jgi:predicted AAA+ superfamily ATPase
LSPFTFREVLAIHEVPVPRFELPDDFGALSDYYQIYRHALWSHFASYLTWGGYPEVVLAESPDTKRILLKEILSTYIQKDVSGFLKIENTSAFNKLVRLLTTQIGSLVNRHELSATLGIDQRTVSKYLDVLEGTYVCSLVKPFFSNARKELSKMPKVYVCDAGIYHFYHAQGFNTYETLSGHLVENYVYLGLRNSERIDNIQFYRTISKSEVDFIVTQKDVLIPIEVKFQASPKMPVSVTRFMENYSAPKAVVITQDRLACSGAHTFLPVPLLEMVTL